MNNTSKNQRVAARRAVKRALRDGTLAKPTTCDECSGAFEKQKLHAHHHKGYAPEHWLNIRWLCAEDHSKAHGGRKVYEFTTEQSRNGGRKGGSATQARRAPEERSVIARQGARRGGLRGGATNAAKPAEELRVIALKGWETRRARGTDRWTWSKNRTEAGTLPKPRSWC